MAMAQAELLRRADEYANRNKLTVHQRLGFGVYGIVLAVDNEAKGSRSAIKVHEYRVLAARKRC